MAESARKQRESLKKELLVLIYHFLQDEALVTAAETLNEIASFDLSQFSVCDNIDLGIIVQEFQTFHQMRFHKRAALVKRREESVEDRRVILKKPRRRPSMQCDQNGQDSKSEANGIGLKVDNNAPLFNQEPLDISLPKSLLQNDETRSLALQVAKDFYTPNNTDLGWTSVIGHEEVKQTLEEMVILPLKHPDLLREVGLSHTKQSVLLTGPAGNGKTLLAKALAKEAGVAFLNISGSTLNSKWRGESEKLMRIAFELAEHNAPCVIFMDEVDAILGDRGSPGEHEASKRSKSEFLIRMDGLASGCENRVFLMAATNLPWTMDPAILRRFQRVFLIDLPGPQRRIEIFKAHLDQSLICSDLDYSMISALTNHFSGSDIARGCNIAKQKLFRRMVDSKIRPQKAQSTKLMKLNEIDITSSFNAIQRLDKSQWMVKYEKFFNKIE